MSEARSKPLANKPSLRPLAIPQRPYALLGAAVIVALGIVVVLAYRGVVGPSIPLFTPEAALFGVASATLVLAVASVLVFFTLRSTNRALAKLEQDVQYARDLAQDGRLHSLEGSHAGASSNANDMTIEIERLESRIASLETPRPAATPLVVLVPALPSASQRADPFGDVHAVIDIEGIGPHYAMRLNAVNVYNTRQLWEADPEQVAAAIEVSVQTVEKWRQMCELLAVKGIGPQYAELLVRSGVTSIVELRESLADDIVARVGKTQAGSDVSIQGNSIGQATVANWIRAAKVHSAGRTRHPYPSGRAAPAQ